MSSGPRVVHEHLDSNRACDVRHPALVWVVAFHAIATFALSALRHAHFGSHAQDLGAYDSVFCNLAHRGTLWNSIERIHQWGNHLELGLLVMWLPYRVAASPLWMFALQSAACAAAAIPIETLARRALGDRRASLLV